MNQSFNLSKNNGLTELTIDQALSIEGGGFWEDISYLAAATAHTIIEFSKQAMDYQNSLPANLKK